MLEIGSVVDGQIERIEGYGAYLRHGQERIFVDHGNYSWEPGGNPLASKTTGDVIPVRIMLYNYKQRITVGSFKHVDLEANPYRQLSRLDPETTFEAQVGRVGNEGALAVLSTGVHGWIPSFIVRRQPVQFGERLRVRILQLDVEQGRLTLEPADDAQDE